MVEIRHINGIGWAIDDITELYKTGELKGILFQILKKDGSCIVGTSALKSN